MYRAIQQPTGPCTGYCRTHTVHGDPSPGRLGRTIASTNSRVHSASRFLHPEETDPATAANAYTQVHTHIYLYAIINPCDTLRHVCEIGNQKFPKAPISRIVTNAHGCSLASCNLSRIVCLRHQYGYYAPVRLATTIAATASYYDKCRQTMWRTYCTPTYVRTYHHRAKCASAINNLYGREC